MLDPLTLDQLRVLVAVAEEGSFSAAARKLGRVQSAISQSVQGLETALGVTIFDRDSGESASVVLPPYERGEPVGTAFEPEALPLCRDDIESGGLPVLDGRAAFTSADARGVDGTEDLLLVSDGSDSRYRRLLMSGTSFDIIGRGSPIVAIVDSGASD